MTTTVLPIYQSALSDVAADTAAGKVTPTRWNQGSAIKLDGPAVLGKAASGNGAVEEIPLGVASAGDVLRRSDGDARFQPLDSDLTSIAALTTTSYGRALLALANGTALGALLTLIQQSVTSTSSTTVQAFQHDNTVDVPSASNDSLSFGQYNKTTLTGSASFTGTAHALGFLNEFINNNTAAQPLLYGGQSTVRNGSGANAVTKLVGWANKVDNQSSSTIGIAESFEAIIQSNSGTISNYIAFGFADHSSISNVTNKWAFKGDDPNAIISNAAPIKGPYGRELAPVAHAGTATGRYYFGGLANYNIGSLALSANTVYWVPLIIPERVTLTKIGCRVTSAVAASHVSVALYKVSAGGIGNYIIDSGSLSSASTGDKEGTISTQVEAGIYVLGVNSDSTPTIQWFDDIGGSRAFWGSDSSTSLGGIPRSFPTYGTWADAPAIAILDTVTIVPSLWVRA